MAHRVRYPKWLRRSLWGLVIALLAFNAAFPPPIDKARQVSSVVSDHEDRWLAGFSIEEGRWRFPADLDHIDPGYIHALIAIEDERFWHHSGVDVPAVFRALRSWRRQGEIVSGASTITMQLVRQIEPRPRTFKSKIIEMGRALQYELFLSKPDILELYLTHISYGGNIEGLHAASLAYLGKEPGQLTDAEIALLIALPQAPEARRPDLRPQGAKTGRDQILDRLGKYGILSPDNVLEAKSDPIPVEKSKVPETAWLTAHNLKMDNRRVRSTLDYRLQSDLEDLASRFVTPLDRPANVAIIVVENETRSVRAHIGSADRSRAGGWIDMTERQRSPGSTLKPFIYGVAIDDGVVSGGSEIDDAPTRFGTYQPENFNRRYHGKVKIYEALQHSLNVPAIAVLDQIGGVRFETTLQEIGITVSKLGGSDPSTGLAIGLGGVGMSLNDLAVIYSALANEGIAAPLKWRETDKGPARRLISAETAREITEILRQAPTPKGRVPSWLVENAPPIAYKTGTSYGFRDAWAAGYSDEWTVIVWVGRPDGAPRHGQTGRIAAAPLLFDVFSHLPHAGNRHDFQQADAAPLGLQKIAEVTETGPQILFPPDGSELLAKSFGVNSRGFALTARSDATPVQYYADGRLIPKHNADAIWRPEAPGFYEITAVDSMGRQSQSNVEVMSLKQLADARF